MADLQVSCRLLPHGADLSLPSYQSLYAAGADLRAALKAPQNGQDSSSSQQPAASLLIPAGSFVAVPTALEIALPEGYEAQVRPRSGLAAKYGVTVLNSPGTIDADYRGEIRVLLINHGKEDFTLQHGDRIAQLLIAPTVQAEFQLVAELPETQRGAGGFGSSGLN